MIIETGKVWGTIDCGKRNCRVKRRLSLACLAEHPVANMDRANASNSVVSGALLWFELRSCVTTVSELAWGKGVSLV